MSLLLKKAVAVVSDLHHGVLYLNIIKVLSLNLTYPSVFLHSVYHEAVIGMYIMLLLLQELDLA